jgi:long-chain acyl-CoA synthetase
MKGYWNKPEETAEAIKDGWLYTGDISYRDEDGYIFITDRKKDIIIRGGENVSPREVEEVLFQHPAVAAAGVVGIKDEVYGVEGERHRLDGVLVGLVVPVAGDELHGPGAGQRPAAW